MERLKASEALDRANAAAMDAVFAAIDKAMKCNRTSVQSPVYVSPSMKKSLVDLGYKVSGNFISFVDRG